MTVFFFSFGALAATSYVIFWPQIFERKKEREIVCVCVCCVCVCVCVCVWERERENWKTD